MLTSRLNQSLFVLASCTLAASSHASYGQMRLDGLGLLLAFMLSVAYGLVVDAALIGRLFRHRLAAVIGSVVGLAVVFLLLGAAALPVERNGYFKGAPGGSELVLLLVTSAVFLPFILIAPFAQYLAMQQGKRWPGWITAWMALQVALLPGFIVLAITEGYFWKQEYQAGKVAGREVKVGGLAGIPERAEQRRERIWGTGWANPLQQKPPPGSYPRTSAWTYGLAKSIDESALVASNEPLGAPDRAALDTLMTKQFASTAVPHIRAKLIWDALEPGRFARQLAPAGVNETGAVGEEVIPVLLERLEKHGEARLCPGGRMMDADRAVLTALVQARGLVWSVEKRANVMRPQWESFPVRLERLCRAPAQSPPPASAASTTDKWLGQWNGPEGTFLRLEGGQGKYEIVIRNLDGPRNFRGSAEGDRILFERDGIKESIRATSGAETRMKWLADKANCLTIGPGEGFCRD